MLDMYFLTITFFTQQFSPLFTVFKSKCKFYLFSSNVRINISVAICQKCMKKRFSLQIATEMRMETLLEN